MLQYNSVIYWSIWKRFMGEICCKCYPLQDTWSFSFAKNNSKKLLISKLWKTRLFLYNANVGEIQLSYLWAYRKNFMHKICFRFYLLRIGNSFLSLKCTGNSYYYNKTSKNPIFRRFFPLHLNFGAMLPSLFIELKKTMNACMESSASYIL